jgi:calcineurin-like phosphoesterase family protein
MKVKIITSFPKVSMQFDNVYFSSDLHEGHQAVIDYGRKFNSLSEMNTHIVDEINKKVGVNDLLVLLGDSMMGEKDYYSFLEKIKCKCVIMLYGNHCNIGKLQAIEREHLSKLLYTGYYLELLIEGQIICCQHYPSFNWNYQDDGAISLHGHLHGDTNPVVDEIHKYKSMDVGVDSYYNTFGEYSIFSLQQIKQLLKDKLIIGRHG